MNQPSLWVFVGLGVVCIVAAIVGGGVTALGNTVPVIHNKIRQTLLAAVGVALIVTPLTIAWYERRQEFTVRAVTASVDSGHYDSCQPVVPFTGVVTTSGTNDDPKANVVTYRAIAELTGTASGQKVIADPIPPTRWHKITIGHPGDTPVTDNDQVLRLNIDPGTVGDTFQYQLRIVVDEPNQMKSEPTNFEVACFPSMNNEN